MDPLKPSADLLVKLGSLLVHYEEYLSPGGRPVDKQVIDSLLADAEVVEWLKAMHKLAYLPKKRTGD